MAKNNGTLIIAPIRTYDSSDKFPVADSNDILGGIHSVATIVKRNEIPLERRRLGMLCYVHSNATYYYLSGGLENINWTVFSDGNYSTATEIFDLDSTDINVNKYIELTYTPASTPIVNITHGTGQKFGIDFYLDGKFLKWDNHNLDGLLEINDQLTVIYNILIDG